MVNATSPLAWQIVGASVRGAAHLRHNLPNQDALAWFPVQERDISLASAPHAGALQIVAVADGHGSAKSFRSDQGAAFAVQTAIAAICEFFADQADLTKLTAIKRLAAERLPQELVRRWQATVTAAIAAAPFSDDERDLLPPNNPLLAYGATLLAVAVAPTFLLALQLGDGDLLTVAASGAVERLVPKDERLMANETTSLCGKEAWRDMRVRFQPLLDDAPALLLAATDGYANSFQDDGGFLKVGADLLDILNAAGATYLHTHLADWLTEASQAGSGDDITVGVLYHP